MSGSGRTGQEFSVGHPVAGGHRLSQTSPGGGTGAEILSRMLEADSWRHYALQRAIPMPPELAAQRSLAGTACGGREEGIYASVLQLSTVSSDLSDSDMLPCPLSLWERELWALHVSV